MKKNYLLTNPIKNKKWAIDLNNKTVHTQSGKRNHEKEFATEALALKDFSKKVQTKFKDGFIYENATASFGEISLVFRFANKYSGFWAQDYHEATGIMAISWPKTQKGEYYKVQLAPFEILLQQDWSSFDLYQLQWVDENKLLGIYNGEIQLIDANDNQKLEVLINSDYQSEVRFEFQNPILVSYATNRLIAQNIDNKKEVFSLSLDAETQVPIFSLHSDKKTLAVAKADGLIEIYTIQTGLLLQSIQTAFEFIDNIQILPQGTDILVKGGPHNPTSRFYTLTTGQEIIKDFDLSFTYLSGSILKQDSIGAYAISSDNKYIVAGCAYINNPQILIFDYETCTLIKSVHIDFVHKEFKLFFSTSNQLLFVRTDTGYMLTINLSV